MILLCGIPTESGVASVIRALNAVDVPYVVFNQRTVRDATISVSVSRGHVSGSLTMRDGNRVDLGDITAVLLRMMDDRQLPELIGEPPESPARQRARSFHELLARWAEVAPIRVVNRYRAMASNFSKPFQQQLIAEQGFATPTTLVTNDPRTARRFLDERGRVVYKSISSERSIVRELTDADLPRLERVRWCPVQFQAFVGGDNIRVHTVGQAVFATSVHTAATDYRYAREQVGEPAQFSAIKLPGEIERQCVRLAQALGLEVAGIDLKLPPGGQPVCLEVNPSPVFSYFEAYTGQPIAAAIARHLAEGQSGPAWPLDQFAEAVATRG